MLTTASRRQKTPKPPVPRPVKMVAAGAFVNRFGSFVVPFLVLFLLHEGYSASDGATAVAAYALGKVAAGPCGGYLTDRVGARSTTALSMFASAATTAALGFAHGLPLILTLAVSCGLSSELYRPATTALVVATTSPGPPRSRAFGVYQLGVSTGMAGGPAVGGIMAEHSYLLLFCLDAATSAVWGVIALLALPASKTAPEMASAVTAPGRPLWRDQRLVRIVAATFLVNLLLFQSQSTLPLWVRHAHMTTGTYGGLLALNAALIAVFQLGSLRFSERRDPLKVVASTSVVIGMGFALLAVAQSLPLVIVSTIVWTVGELVQWPIAASYTASLAPEGQSGRYAGARSLAFGLALLAAPLVGVTLYNASPTATWPVLGLSGVLAAALLPPFRRRSHGRHS